MQTDPRRAVPPTDSVLADPRLAEPQRRLGRPRVRDAVHASQERVRDGSLSPAHLLDDVLRRLPARATSLTPVINATGTVLHTNLGRAPLSAAARDALIAASGYVDVEYDLADGTRATRGRGHARRSSRGTARRRRRDGREQRRRSAAAGGDGAGERPRGGLELRRAGGDRRWISPPRSGRLHGRHAPRGRNDQSDHREPTTWPRSGNEPGACSRCTPRTSG